ncbi:hypothetical protein QBC38DRAFT_485761 [Podospora fimiseda]|uniref:Uncharacterized protein n=1 Tax=Podospora fimiseda TaxID=252190 RepID=A0AAN7GTM9_9PEZI|nr:hypothetical protein QBC38DRAFT_485761 [Podospora fimiseda]
MLFARDVIPFPGGDNSSDTILGGVHFNLTTLEHWNYTLYSNNTVSNGSWCYLTFERWTADLLLENGTWVNGTKCWSPIDPIGVRAGVGIGFSVLFGLSLVLTLVALGRRWQWYWAIWTIATALISLLTVMDVDRYYLPELPIILTSFFWFLMQMGAMAIVWEAVRHWGSWMERQFIDPDPYALREDDTRSQIEFYLPLVYYLFWWLNFFLIVPRSWTAIQHQRYPEQIINDAAPTATSARFKAAAFMLVICWFLTLASLRTSIKYYRPRNRGIINRVIGFIKFTPMRFKILLPLAAAVPAFQALVAWHFDFSPLKVEGNLPAIYAGGYLPSLLIIYVQAIFGFLNPNEDKELQHQRQERTLQLNNEMGIVPKPTWWKRINGEMVNPNESMRDALVRNVREIQGNKPRPTNPDAIPGGDGGVNNQVRDVEMSPLPSPTYRQQQTPSPTIPSPAYNGKSERRRQERAMQAAAGMLFPQSSSEQASEAARRRAELVMDGPPPPPPPPPAVAVVINTPPPPYPDSTTQERRPSMQTTGSAATSTNQPPQRIRSMLDV